MFFGESKQFEGYFKPFLKDFGIDLDKLIISLAEEVTKNKFTKDTKQCLITLIVLLACDSYLDLSSKKVLTDDDFELVIQKYKGQKFNPFHKISANVLRLSFMNMKSTLRTLISNRHLVDSQIAEFLFVGAFIDALTQQPHASVDGKNDIAFMIKVGRYAMNNDQVSEISDKLRKTFLEKTVIENNSVQNFFLNEYCKFAMDKIERHIPENVISSPKKFKSQHKLS